MPIFAMYLNKSYATAPPGVYFNPATGGFTVMALTKLISLNYYQKIFYFGNVHTVDNIVFGSYATTSTIQGRASPGRLLTISNSSVSVNVWVHLAFTSTQRTAKF